MKSVNINSYVVIDELMDESYTSFPMIRKLSRETNFQLIFFFAMQSKIENDSSDVCYIERWYMFLI